MEEIVITPMLYDRCSKGRLMEVLGKCIEGANIKAETKEIKHEIEREIMQEQQ